MTEPDYKRPFEQTDFRGYFEWTAELTNKLGSPLFHACHEDELRECLDDNELGLRSSWKLNLPEHGVYECPGVWTGLNYYNAGNKYGPLLMEFPLAVLNGRHFIVFRRGGDSDRPRFFFVQYEARVPIYSFGTSDTEGRNSWRIVKASSYFDAENKSLALKSRAIYDIVLTQPLSLDHVRIDGIGHPSCIPGKCKGTGSMENTELAAKIGLEQISTWMKHNAEYAALVQKFPSVVGETVELKRPKPKSTTL